MEKMKVITLGCVMLVAAGCFAEDYSFCIREELPNNVTLGFELPRDGVDIFMDNVFTTHTVFYDDATGEFVKEISTTLDDHLLTFPGIQTRLEPGVYRVLSWGNYGQNTSVEGDYGRLYFNDNTNVTYGRFGDDRTVGNGDKLYYAPNTVSIGTTGQGNTAGEYIMTVDEVYGHDGTLRFRHAHRTIEVYVKGFQSGDVRNPVVRISGLPGGLSFLGMGRLPEEPGVTASIRSEMVTVEVDGDTEYYALAAFDVFYMNLKDHDIVIEVADPATGFVSFSAPIGDYIDPIADDPEEDIVIRLAIEFIGVGQVTVTIPSWKPGDVGYGIFD